MARVSAGRPAPMIQATTPPMMGMKTIHVSIMRSFRLGRDYRNHTNTPTTSTAPSSKAVA
jgi:hypothetical protein